MTQGYIRAEKFRFFRFNTMKHPPSVDRLWFACHWIRMATHECSDYQLSKYSTPWSFSDVISNQGNTMWQWNIKLRNLNGFVSTAKFFNQAFVSLCQHSPSYTTHTTKTCFIKTEFFQTSLKFSCHLGLFDTVLKQQDNSYQVKQSFPLVDRQTTYYI